MRKKVLRVFLFTFLGTFLTGLLFAEEIATGLRVDFDLLGSFKLGLIAGVIAALLRLVVAMLPVFVDDTVGRKRKAGGKSDDSKSDKDDGSDDDGDDQKDGS